MVVLNATETTPSVHRAVIERKELTAVQPKAACTGLGSNPPRR